MSTDVDEPTASPAVRPLVWRGAPLHYAVPVLIGLLGLGLLALGGVPAIFGGWWLATALPLAIGGFFRDPWLLAVPVVVWAVWVIIGAIAGPDSSIANTPIPAALALALIGVGGTYLAQRAVFPAIDPDLAEGEQPARRLPSMDDEPEHETVIEPLPVEDGEDLDPVLSDLIEVEDDADADEDEGEDEAPKDESDAAPGVEAEGSADESDHDGEESTEDASPKAEADEPKADDAEPEADAEPDADAEPEADAESGDDAEPTADADEPEDEPQAVEEKIERPAKELPIDADPTPLDEGGHVEEFAAISEADLAKADADAETETA